MLRCNQVPIFPSIRIFSSELALRIRWPKYWSFSFSTSPSNEYSGLISCTIDWFDLLAVLRNSQDWIFSSTTVAAKSLQSCPTLCDPIDSSPPGSLIPGILQASTLEWVAISFSSAGKWKVKGKSLSRVRLFETPWTVAYQAPPPMGFSRQEYWNGVPLLSPIISL